MAPLAHSFNLITQNVDRLSTIAAEELQSSLKAQGLTTKEDRAPKDSLIQMHGKLLEVLCTKCDWREENLSHPLCQALADADAAAQDYHEAGSNDHQIPLDQLPRCKSCGELARPGVVWFGEMPHHLKTINSLVLKADLCLVNGTSSTVRQVLSVTVLSLDIATGQPCGRLCVSCSAAEGKCRSIQFRPKQGG